MTASESTAEANDQCGREWTVLTIEDGWHDRLQRTMCSACGSEGSRECLCSTAECPVEFRIAMLFGSHGIESIEDVLRDDQGPSSPIERAMFIALLIVMGGDDVSPVRLRYRAGDTGLLRGDSVDAFSESLIMITSQSKIGKYRVDFLVEFHDSTGIGDRRLAIECDGHHYHERTKKQAKHDRKRDRLMQSEGYEVLRFTGSEIWDDPFKCAREAMGALKIFPCY